MVSIKPRILKIAQKLDLDPFLGQHLLVDEKVIDKMISFIPQKALVIEIGAGCGQLTRKLLRNQNKVIAVEIDKKFLEFLEPLRKKYAKRLKTVYKDILKLDLQKLTNQKNFWLTGSLPYHIIEPLISKIIFLSFQQAVFLVSAKWAFESQKDLKSSSKINKQALLVQSFFDLQVVEKVPKTSFFPQPRVNSAIILLKPKKSIKKTQDPTLTIFQQLFLAAPRNPLIKNCLREILIKQKFAKTKNQARNIIKELKIPPQILEKPLEQLNNEQLASLYFSLRSFFQGS